MLISRNQPGVSTCDNCRAVKRPVVSWTCLDNSDGLGASIVGTVHLCQACLALYSEKLSALPPFMEVMRYELSEIGIDVPPKAKYEEILERYNGEGLGRSVKPVVLEALPQPEPRQPTIPEIRRMPKADLQVEIARYQLHTQPEDLTREQMIEALIAHFERAVSA